MLTFGPARRASYTARAAAVLAICALAACGGGGGGGAVRSAGGGPRPISTPTPAGLVTPNPTPSASPKPGPPSATPTPAVPTPTPTPTPVPATASVSGRVTDDSGTPVAGATVYVGPNLPKGANPVAFGALATTAADGSFTVAGVQNANTGAEYTPGGGHDYQVTWIVV